jgi:hypothetical protein
LGDCWHTYLILFDFTRSRSTTSDFSLTCYSLFFQSKKHYNLLLGPFIHIRLGFEAKMLEWTCKCIPTVLSMWPYTLKIGLKRIQNMRVWLRKMAFAQHICRGFWGWWKPPKKPVCSPITEECNKYDLTTLPYFLLANHIDSSRWFAISCPPTYLESFWARVAKK